MYQFVLNKIKYKKKKIFIDNLKKLNFVIAQKILEATTFSILLQALL